MPYSKPTLLAALAALGLALTACPSTPSTNADPTNPYASGAQYPWEDTGISSFARSALTNGNLSDQAWTGATNGWGPVERNLSNGEQNAGDGKTIKLGGVSYARGLGVHANSRISYALSGACSSFQADIGLDDEVRFQTQNGSVVFQVWADGTKLYDSGVMTTTTATKSINVNLSGRTSLELVVTDAGNGNWYDHADWANARVACSAVPTPPPSPSPPPAPGKPDWANVSSWGVQYHGFNSSTAAAVNALDSSGVQVLVIGRFDGVGKEWQYNDVTRLVQKKWVFSYLSIGQAQTIEWYWQSWWTQGNPWWIANPWSFGGTYNVQYWASEWQDLMKRSIDRIVAAGFDGVFFDQSDPYWNTGFPGGPSAENIARSKDLVCNIATYARSRKAGFRVIANGGGNQIDSFGSSYWDCLDGTAGEHLWYTGTGQPERSSYRDWTIPVLKRTLPAGKKVFTFDYTSNSSEINQILSASRGNGFIPTISSSSINITPILY